MTSIFGGSSDHKKSPRLSQVFSPAPGPAPSLKMVFSYGLRPRLWLLAQGSCQSCPGPLKLMTSQVVQGTWLKKGGYGRFRGQCVKNLTTIKKKIRKKGKNEKINLSGTRIDHMTERKRRQNLAKCCTVSLQS